MKRTISYSRDKRSPKPKNESVSRIMSANKAKNTKPEIFLRKNLWSNKIKGYRVHNKNFPGKPDIAFIAKKIAIFVNGCFWHRCPHCNYALPKNNTLFWKNKFDKNIQRDQTKIETLNSMGWKTLLIWECELKKDFDKHLKTIKNLYEQMEV